MIWPFCPDPRPADVRHRARLAMAEAMAAEKRAQRMEEAIALAIRSGATGDEIIPLADKLAAHIEAVRKVAA